MRNYWAIQLRWKTLGWRWWKPVNDLEWYSLGKLPMLFATREDARRAKVRIERQNVFPLQSAHVVKVKVVECK
jgi:hypothetical protein